MIDFHTHSNYSDGTLSPEQLIIHAKEKGLKMLALTDHDTVTGLHRAKIMAQQQGLDFIPGIELAAQNDRTLHILGLSIDPDHEVWRGAQQRMRDSRRMRNERIVHKLNSLGIMLSMEDLYRQAKGTVSRVHIARWLVEKGICPDISTAFKEYLVRGGKAYQARESFSAKECMDMIHQAGGIAVVAHLHTVDMDGFSSRMTFMTHMKELGVDGLECYYHDYSIGMMRECIEIAKTLGLIMTGGSDFHGENKPNQIGKTQLGDIPDFLHEEYYKNR